ncbi:hypothetical protein ANCCAN_16757 [Ancylostoma caninum]|uniref:Uncharacterized protein n=1 Tax=Ancylostoma caninum TaxID=29170 RepID=A0A368FYQ4_ANCCA|nr:hypothetical protein ANCCAN_16757 [Ancylostoma caninum]
MQRRALRFTWHRLQTRNGGKRVENVFEEVFDRLVRALPCVRDMFTTRMFLCAMARNETASLRDHAKVSVFLLLFSVHQYGWNEMLKAVDEPYFLRFVRHFILH